MKKTYELVQVNMISLGNDDVIRTSAYATKRSASEFGLGGNFDLGDYNTQIFS